MMSSSQSNLVVVLCSCSNEKSATNLARCLVKNRLAGCVKVLPVKSSIYLWEGDVVNETESLMIIKTLDSKAHELERFITQNHEYETPEVLVIPEVKSNEDYRAWIEQCLS